MFSQILNKAKGLFPGTAADDSSFTAHASTSEEAAATDSTIDSTPRTTKMVTATRRGQISSPQVNGSADAAASGSANGKRRTRVTVSDSQAKKRRRTESEGDDGDDERHETSVMVEIPVRRKHVGEEEAADEVCETQQTNGASNGTEHTEESRNTTKKDSSKHARNHIRFGSEEPTPELKGREEIPETRPVPPEEEESSDDDDEAPEVVDNSAQLLSLKAQAQKQEEARKRDEILRKEKRKLQDERNKAQAKASKKTRLEQTSETRPAETSLQDDDLVSESTATIQGSVVRESGRMVLPDLLPDEILNAEPVYRAPSPVSGQPRQSTKKHKFFDDVKKPAKDVRHGDVTIRVLENDKRMLPPKSSKAGQNLKAAWMAGRRNKSGPPGLKRVSGGPKSFVRR